uniref:Uncharacterized protein LOC107425100 isoform X3 n=1 Tax=Rhizophora mucronata TaxID=61149 RepID=A0A2P2L344_RHIMU
MAVLRYLLLLFPAILSPAAVVGSGGCVSVAGDRQTYHPNCSLAGELHDAKLKVANLESAHEEITENVKARDRCLAEGKKQIEDMEKKIMQLHSTLANLKVL